jgi:AcrR family transcriptional regulator
MASVVRECGRLDSNPLPRVRLPQVAYVEWIEHQRLLPGASAAGPTGQGPLALSERPSTSLSNPAVASDTETAIFQAAADLLEAHGPAGLTTRAICAAVGIKAPTLYHHFGGMDSLALALVRQGRAEFKSRRRAPKASDDLMKQLRAHWDDAVDFTFKRPHLYALLVEKAQNHPELLDETFADMRALVQRLVDSGRFRVSLDDAARAILAAFNGVLSLRQWGTTSAREVAATSDLVFTALITELSRKR